MNEINDGGPAFPTNYSYSYEDKGPGDWREKKGTLPGISIRDYFAAIALQGFLANQRISQFDVCSEQLNKFCEHSAKGAYQMADAMLTKRAKLEGK